MILNTIEIHNFLSIGKIYIDFDKLGNIVYVKGINGSGKSALIEAIYFAVFGKTLRKSAEKTLRNNRTKGKCMVILTANGTTKINRTKSPNTLNVTINGVEHIGGSMFETQAMLEKHLNINRKVFLASMVFGQQNEMSFLTATSEEKRQILQSFLNASAIFENRNNITALKSKFASELKVARSLLDSHYESVKNFNLKIGNIRNTKKDAENLLTPEKKEFIRKYSLSDIQQMEKDNHEADLNIRTLQMKLKGMVDSFDKTKKELSDTIELKCEKCGELSTYASARLSLLKERYKELSVTTPPLRKEIQHRVALLDASAVPISSDDFQSIECIKSFEKEIEMYVSMKEDMEEKIELQGNVLMLSNRSLSLMKFWEGAFSEHGLIKYVIRNILEFFNNRVNFYLNMLSNGGITVEFNDVLEETVYNQGSEVSYGTLSGGEKKRVSLAVMLSLNDLLTLSGKDRSNIIFFDEIAESLDDEGVDCLFHLMKTQAVDKKLFIITHHEYLTSLLTDNAQTLEVTKLSGVTSLVIT